MNPAFSSTRHEAAYLGSGPPSRLFADRGLTVNPAACRYDLGFQLSRNVVTFFLE